MKPGLRMAAGLARVRRGDRKVVRLVRAAYADDEGPLPTARDIALGIDALMMANYRPPSGQFASLSDVTRYFTRLARDGAFERWERGPDHFGVMGYTPMRAPKDFS